jgi:hypothetical protein
MKKVLVVQTKQIKIWTHMQDLTLIKCRGMFCAAEILLAQIS